MLETNELRLARDQNHFKIKTFHFQRVIQTQTKADKGFEDFPMVAMKLLLTQFSWTENQGATSEFEDTTFQDFRT